MSALTLEAALLLWQAFLDKAKPTSAVMLVHNGGNRAIQRLQALHPKLYFAALGPHVAATVRSALRVNTHWMMATWPFHPKVRFG